MLWYYYHHDDYDYTVMVGIYKITSPSGKIYIGQSRDISSRFSRYKNLNYYKDQSAIWNSMSKHGVQNHQFKVVHKLPEDINQEILDTYEVLYWQMYKDCDVQMLNIRIPGSRGPRPSGWKHSDEAKLKIKKAKSKNPPSGGFSKRAVLKMDTEGKVLEEFPSITAAAGSKNRSSAISMCCNEKYRNKTAYGFK